MAPALPRPFPDTPIIAGRLVDLEQLDPLLHGPDLWRAIGTDPGLWDLIPPGPFADQAGFSEWLTPHAGRTDVTCYAIVDKTTRAALGLFLLLGISTAMGTAEMGLIYGPGLARRTAGSEAFFLLGRYMLETLAYRRLEWRCTPEHVASRRAAERFGFTLEGILRQTFWLKERSWDSAIHAMLDHEWPAAAKRLEAWLSPDNFDDAGRQIRRLESL